MQIDQAYRYRSVTQEVSLDSSPTCSGSLKKKEASLILASNLLLNPLPSPRRVRLLKSCPLSTPCFKEDAYRNTIRETFQFHGTMCVFHVRDAVSALMLLL